MSNVFSASGIAKAAHSVAIAWAGLGSDATPDKSAEKTAAVAKAMAVKAPAGGFKRPGYGFIHDKIKCIMIVIIKIIIIITN